MTAHRVNATTNPTQLQAVRDALNNIFQNLPFLIELKPEERQSMTNYGEKNRSFVVEAIAEQNPDNCFLGNILSYSLLTRQHRAISFIGFILNLTEDCSWHKPCLSIYTTLVNDRSRGYKGGT